MPEKDEYGTYTYKINNKKLLPGNCDIKQNEIITVEYKIPNSKNNLFWIIPTDGTQQKSAKEYIEITLDMNGKTLTRSDFNFKVERRIN